MLKKGELNADDVAAMLKVSRRTLFRELRAAHDREVLAETARSSIRQWSMDVRGRDPEG
jgi:hypothetical protein